MQKPKIYTAKKSLIHRGKIYETGTAIPIDDPKLAEELLDRGDIAEGAPKTKPDEKADATGDEKPKGG